MSRIKMTPIQSVAAVAAVWLIFGTAVQAQQAVAGPSKVAVIDVRRILTESEAGREALEALGEMAEGERATLDALDAEIKAMQGRLEDGALSLSADKQDAMTAEIQQKMIEMSRAQDDARQRVETSQSKQFGAIEARVMPLIAAIGEEQGFTLIFNKFEDSGLLWAQEGADITGLVLERFNALPES